MENHIPLTAFGGDEEADFSTQGPSYWVGRAYDLGSVVFFSVALEEGGFVDVEGSLPWEKGCVVSLERAWGRGMGGLTGEEGRWR